MLHALVHRQDGEIAGAGQAAVAEQGRQRAQDPRAPVAHHPDPVDEIGPRQVQALLGEPFALVVQQVIGLRAQQRLDFFDHGPPP